MFTHLIPTKQNVKTITDMREDAIGLLRHVKKHGMAYIFYQSEPAGVFLSTKKYLRLMNRIEDAEDTLLALKLHKEALDTPKDELISFDDLLKDLHISKKELDDFDDNA